jgi:DNA-binding transcriptional MocR family regulator
MKRVVDLGTSAILQYALADFMERGYLRAHMTRIVREYRARRDALVAALEKAMPPDVRWRVPTHGLVLWIDLPRGIDVDAVYEEALRRGVLVSPSPIWNVEGDEAPGIRLAFCAEPRDRLVEGARRLGKALKTLLGRAPRRARADETVIETV